MRLRLSHMLGKETAQQSTMFSSDIDWQNVVLHMDALELMERLPDNSVPLIITDPPYGIGYHSNYYKDRNPHAPIINDWDFPIQKFLQECSRVLKDGGALYLFSRWDVSPLWLPHIKSTGLKTKTVIAWVKDNWSAGDLEGCFGNQYEQILFITKGRHLLRGKRWSNVWEFPRVPADKLLHPTQKPVGLVERAICASSDEGDMVLDCYAGSGTAGKAAINTGRAFLLGDIDKRMVSIARRRLHLIDDTVLEQPDNEQVTYTLDLPVLEEWGMHPEQVAELYAAIKGNWANFNVTEGLWDTR